MPDTTRREEGSSGHEIKGTSLKINILKMLSVLTYLDTRTRDSQARVCLL